MKNKFIYIFIYILINLFFTSNLNSKDIFSFNVTEIQITQDGNLFKGYNGGEAFTNDGVSITAENFEYNKITNILIAKKNVRLVDKKKNIIINAEKISYLKNEEKVFAIGNVKLVDKNKNIIIKTDEISYLKNKEKIFAKGDVQLEDKTKDIFVNANQISYLKNEGKIVADGNVVLIDKSKDITINTIKITYLKNINKIYSEGETKAYIGSKYKFFSKDVTFLKDEMKLYSSEKTIINDSNLSTFELGSFDYEIKKEFLKGTNIIIVENSSLPPGKSDKLYFSNGFFNLKNRNFKTGSTKIKLKKNLFDRPENDPRLYGVSSTKKDGITSVKKAVFTSCKKTDSCPPWQLEASEIKHDKNKKQLIYDNAILKVYDVPVFYFPKFFHPDPTVKRQSGFLQPKLNNSNILGSSLSVPYFYAISKDKDLTFSPVLFSNDVKMIQTEFRQKYENSSIITDFGITNNYTSSSTNKKKNINHFFARLEKSFKLDNFIKSDLNIFFERTNKDTYLKIFGDNLSESNIKPKNNDILNSGFDFFLEHEDFLFSGGADSYEDLTKKQSDRYQYILPYYNYSKNLISSNYGDISLNSKGNNILDNTNNVKSRVINDISFKMNEKIFNNLGLRNNFNIFFKNLNSVGKNVSNYKSSPQIELQSLIELNSELPLIKITDTSSEFLIPRLSLRLNPGDMKDHSSSEREINMNNIFDINRLGLDDSFESGNSLTLGIDYKKENEENYLEIKLASVFRDDIEINIPSQTTLNKKNSNLFGEIDYRIFELLNLNYNFSIDNKIENFEYNSVGLGLSLNNFVTNFNFIEEDSILGNTNVFENISKYNFNKENSLSFKTRRNREVNLTEYYDLIYEYKNDCLTAGIRFNKTYYEDRDLKPSEKLMFTINFYPLTSIEQSVK